MKPRSPALQADTLHSEPPGNPDNENMTTQSLWDSVKAVLRGRFGEGNGTPLQYSRLENPMDGGA